MKIQIKRALLSVSDKTGIVNIASVLQEFGCEIISTGGTKKVLLDAGIKVTDISEITGHGEAFGGRMKTISFNIESALLFDRKKDKEEAKKLGIKPIDLVVCNLYPFKEISQKRGELGSLIENIDIGGPTMIRAAAKNFKDVAVVTQIEYYPWIIDELKENKGAISVETSLKLMRIAFNYTADYDSCIASTMDDLFGEGSFRLSFKGFKELRYGENSHQKGYFFKKSGAKNSLYDMKILNGKELSFNNIVDIQGAIEAVKDLKRNGCAIIKHTNPCGICEGDNQRTVFELAWESDPVSAFGSVIAFNNEVEHETVKFLELDNEDKKKRKFVEVIIAPKYSKKALEYLSFHKDLRIIEFDPEAGFDEQEYKFVNGAVLVQDRDNKLYSKLETVTEIKNPIDSQLLEFGIIATRQVKSNAIVVVRRIGQNKNQKTTGQFLQLLGSGGGQPNRLSSIKIAMEKCKENLAREYQGEEQNKESYINDILRNCILISDGFFPFPDNVELCASYGIKTIFQPGGSLRDKTVIKKSDELGISMTMVGMRHFKH